MSGMSAMWTQRTIRSSESSAASTSGLERGDVLATTPLAFRVGDNSVAVLFRYGVVVLIGLNALEEEEFLRSLQGYLRTQFADQNQAITNVVVTGGGASFLQSIQPKVSQAFIIPDGPQTASVRGAYEAQFAKVGAQ